MNLRDHILIGGAASLGLYPTLGVQSGIFWFASVAIDADHYWDFVSRNGFRDFSVKRMFKYNSFLFESNCGPGFLGLNIFHTVEFLLGVYFIAAWWNSSIVLTLFSGMLFHMILDWAFLLKHGMLFKRAFSFVDYWTRKRILIRRGFLPDIVFQQALDIAEQDTREQNR